MGLKNIIQPIAPSLSMALSGSMGSVALKIIAHAVTGDEDTSEHQILQILEQGIDLDVQNKLYEADYVFKMQMQQLSIDFILLNTDSDVVHQDPFKNRKSTRNENREVYRLGIVIMLFNALVMIAVLWGCFTLLVSPDPIRDESMKSIVSALIGTIVGYVAANAQQVVGYFFGSSKGSTDKTDALAAAAGKKTELF
jgi:hypothetical protein